MKSLVIVESPAKAKTINKYLGKDYVVKSSVGHIRDLDKFPTVKQSKDKEKQKYNKLVQQMGVDPESDWSVYYAVISGKKKVVDELKKYAKICDKVYLASDLDREGEAISWHIKELLGVDESKYHRVIFNEITQKAIKEAFEKPVSLDMMKVYSQHARRYLDRVVGYMLSPLLWKKIARGLSAGRVQSVALRMIVEREKEIYQFRPEEYWEIDADLSYRGRDYLFSLKKLDDKNIKIVNEKRVKEIKNLLKGKIFKISKREEKKVTLNPSPPFITSTLQQAASLKLGFGVKKTMLVAQKLYEAGYITYMRTDSTNISQDALASCRNYIKNHIGKDYLPDKPLYYRGKKNAQEAHEAIRPSNVLSTMSEISPLGKDAESLYNLIRNKFISSQMSKAVYLNTALGINIDGFYFSSLGRITVFDGFTKIYSGVKQQDVEFDKEIKEGCEFDFNQWESKQKFTKPPARFNEASLVKELEKKSIGRPSTYATIITTLQDRGYVKIESKRFFLQKIGEIVVNRLKDNFDELMSYDFTAMMEEKLDDISDGKVPWKEVLDEFYYPFKNSVSKALEDDGMLPNMSVGTNIPCKVCKTGKMKIRNASTGVFLSCSNYDLSPKERCKATINLIIGSEAIVSDEKELKELLEAKECGVCGNKMKSYLMDEKRKIYICDNNPDCSGYEIENGNFKIKGYEGPTIECDKCQSEMQLKMGRFGKYFACINCNNTRKLMKNGQVAKVKMDPVHMKDIKCEKVDDYYLLRDGERGLFLAASKFPKNREIRAVYVDELILYKNELPDKYKYLTNAPVADKKGSRTFLKYDKKKEEHYVVSDKKLTPTGWRAYFIDGQWGE